MKLLLCSVRCKYFPQHLLGESFLLVILEEIFFSENIKSKNLKAIIPHLKKFCFTHLHTQRKGPCIHHFLSSGLFFVYRTLTVLLAQASNRACACDTVHSFSMMISVMITVRGCDMLFFSGMGRGLCCNFVVFELLL